MDNQITQNYFTSNGLEEDVSSSSSRNFSTKEGGFFAFLVSSDPASYAPLESNSYQLQSLTIKGSGRINLDDVDEVFPELDIYSWVDTLTGDLGSYYFGYLSLTKSISVDSKDYLALVGFDGHSSVDAYTYLYPDEPGDLRVSYLKGAAIKVKGVSATLYSYYDHTGLDPWFEGANANFMGPITMDGTTGTASLDLVNSLIATEVRYDGASFSDIDLESPLSPFQASYDQYLSSIKGGAVSVKTKGESVYLSL